MARQRPELLLCRQANFVIVCAAKAASQVAGARSCHPCGIAWHTHPRKAPYKKHCLAAKAEGHDGLLQILLRIVYMAPQCVPCRHAGWRAGGPGEPAGRLAGALGRVATGALPCCCIFHTTYPSSTALGHCYCCKKHVWAAAQKSVARRARSTASTELPGPQPTHPS